MLHENSLYVCIKSAELEVVDTIPVLQEPTTKYTFLFQLTVSLLYSKLLETRVSPLLAMLHAACLCCRKCTGTVLQRSAAVGHLSLCAASRGWGEETAKIRTRFNLLRSMFHFSSVRSGGKVRKCSELIFLLICRTGLLKLISNCNTHLQGSLQCSLLAIIGCGYSTF